MISETARVIAIEPDCLWVETVRRSTCGSCEVKKGCGHGLLNEVGSQRTSHLRVLLNGLRASDFSINDQVEISIPEEILVKGALLVYLMPLLTMLLSAFTASQFWSGDVAVFFGGVVGFIAGFALVKLHARLTENDTEQQPTLTASQHSPVQLA
jgi:sigma-E factor negative regulatory protein RseC